MRTLLHGILLWPFFGAFGAFTRAQPTVRVLGESRIELETENAVNGVRVAGALRDDLGAPLAGQFLEIEARPPSPHAMRTAIATVRTDAEGLFTGLLEIPSAEHVVSATFYGDVTHSESRVERPVRFGRTNTRLEVEIEAELDLDRPSHPIRIVAFRGLQRAPDVVVTVSDEREQLVAPKVTTGPTGEALAQIPSSSLGAPGGGRLVARSEGTGEALEAQVEVPIVRFRRAHLTLAIHTGGTRNTASGALANSREPLSHRAIGLFAVGSASDQGRHIATVLTDARGSYEASFTLPADAAALLQARFESDGPGHPSARSPMVSLRTKEGTTAINWLWLLLPMAVCALVVVVVARRAPRAPEKGEFPSEERAPGVQRGRRVRSADPLSVDGRVVDHRSGSPVGGAQIELSTGPSPVLATRTDGAGAFHFGRIPKGRYVLSVRAEGYGELTADLAVPHRGEWCATEIRLVSLRMRALAALERAAHRWLPRLEAWTVWTNREVGTRLKSLPAAPAVFREVLGTVEDIDRAYYGAAPPSLEDVEGIESKLDAAVQPPVRPRPQ